MALILMKKCILFIAFIALSWLGKSQGSYPPQAGEAGSTAIPADSSCFRDWAIAIDAEIGYRRIDIPDSGKVSTGALTYALGASDAPLTLSLGDSGVATFNFSAPIYDGEGYDFAVFENGFGSGSESFLELAFVEVSSDGIHFLRFPCYSEIQNSIQIASFETMDASYLHNLAGKYITGFGTPFDLSELPDTSIIDKQAITHVRLVDVIGSIDSEYASRDHLGRIINDPWPTSFESGGFDVDAIGVINSLIPLSTTTNKHLDAAKHQANPVHHIDLLGRSTQNSDDWMLIKQKN